LVDVVGRQPLDPEQMAVRERGLGGASLHEPGTIRGASLSRNNVRCRRIRAPTNSIGLSQTIAIPASPRSAPTRSGERPAGIDPLLTARPLPLLVTDTENTAGT
jgi:hypothetical protein